MKLFFRIVAILVVSVISVVLVQRLILKLYTDIGKRYITIETTDY